MNARFWIYYKGFVKITLKPNQKINLRRCTDIKQGYEIAFSSYFYDGESVMVDHRFDIVDCYGRMTAQRTLSCHRNNLKIIKCERYLLPEWKKENLQKVY